MYVCTIMDQPNAWNIFVGGEEKKKNQLGFGGVTGFAFV